MKKDAKTPDWVAKDIKSGEFKNLYLICGSEEYLKKNRMRQLIHALAPDADEMNLAEFKPGRYPSFFCRQTSGCGYGKRLFQKRL